MEKREPGSHLALPTFKKVPVKTKMSIMLSEDCMGITSVELDSIMNKIREQFQPDPGEHLTY